MIDFQYCVLEMKLVVGERSSYERRFATKDVEPFAELSADKGSHHTKTDSEGQLNVSMDFVCYNQNGKEVLRGKTSGIIRA